LVPTGLVPAARFAADDALVWESMDILRELETRFPDAPALTPADEDGAAKMEAFIAREVEGAFYLTLVPIRPRRRGERRSLRTLLPGDSLRLGSHAFNPRPRRLSTSTDAFQLHPDVRSYVTAPSRRRRRRGRVQVPHRRRLRRREGPGRSAETPSRTRGRGRASETALRERFHRRRRDDHRGRSRRARARTTRREFAHVSRLRSPVRSILHWSPYERVGDVNADP
jgi:hypothetical protein